MQYISPLPPWKKPFEESKTGLTKKLRAAILELLQAVKKFTPTDKSVEEFDAVAPDNGQARRYGKTPNDEYWTDHDAVRLRNAVDDLQKLLGTKKRPR